jgi:chemotaxis receptor (MCP) glutamine deamidase CheD
MAHITHSDLTERNPNRPGKYVASGLEALIEMMERTGAFRNRLVAAVIGGAEISVTNGEDNQDALVLDSGVCRALHLELHRNGVWIRAEDVGGKTDRSVKFDAANGAVRIRKGSSDNLLCELGAAPTKAVAA